ncbi:hypothetical protein BC832DRAFT_610975 [Gaertneriomyces semiglobifer]|nr:hypothetical protein BC832DRAFT_610975 [Gaertneriomyces semiglobifer]
MAPIVPTGLAMARQADIVNTPKWKQKEIASLRNGMRDTVYMINGDRYIGEWNNGLKHGNGTYHYAATGAVYQGEWQNDVRHGFGTYSVPARTQRKSAKQGALLPSVTALKKSQSPSSKPQTPTEHKQLRKVYAGQWENDVRHGHGTCFYDDGSMYDGMWNGDVREGWGRMHYKSDDSMYEGEWHEGVRHGQGVLVLGKCSNGDRYEGAFLNDLKEGPGRFIYRNKRQLYKGEWALDLPKCGTLIDLPPREGHQPRKWPIPKLGLRDPDTILATEQKLILEDRLERIMGPSDEVKSTTEVA